VTVAGWGSLADQAFISDSRTAALVDRDGVIGWYCPLGFDRPSVFASLLDPDAGHWRIGPARQARSTREYVGDSLVLRTEFDAGDSAFSVTDLLAFEPGAEGHDVGRRSPNVLVRFVEGQRGRSAVQMELAPRLEYGLTVPRPRAEGRSVRMEAGPLALRLDGDVPVQIERDRLIASFELRPGESAAFSLSAWDPLEREPPTQPDGRALAAATIEAWRSWTALHQGYRGVAPDAVRRSSLVLQGLTDARTGAVVAAATTSLPEIVGGSANWDYRFAWLRDLSFVMRALWVAACPDEADAFLRFLAQALGRLDGRRIPIVLGSDGRRAIPEHALTHLRGWRDSRPVRIGNDAWTQRQLDVLGEVLDSALLLGAQVERYDEATRDLLVSFAERAAADWRTTDAGMWEARDRERPYTSSKVMCWVALDRAIQLATKLGGELPLDRWLQERDLIRTTVLDEAWSERTGAFAGALGSDDLDASVLLMPLVGFLEADDPRMRATIDAVRDRLTSGPLVHRWDGDANGFLLCSYWLVECEALTGRPDEARRRFDGLAAFATDLGLMTEMVAPGSGEPIGNLPQAFSHIGLINAAWRLSQPRS